MPPVPATHRAGPGRQQKPGACFAAGFSSPRPPPAMPPKNTPGINSNPVFHDKNPCFEYAISASTPVGGINATREVPCARCWLNPNSNPSSGTSSTPPPIPNIPEATPHTHATAKIPAMRPIDSSMNFPLAASGRVRIAARLSPKQKSRQYQEAAEQPLQVLRRQGERYQASGVSAEEHSQCAQNPCR